MAIALSRIMSHRPNLVAVLPTGCVADHNVLLNEASDDLTAERQTPHFVIRELVPSVDNQKPTTRQSASAEWRLVRLFAHVLKPELLQNGLWRFPRTANQDK